MELWPQHPVAPPLTSQGLSAQAAAPLSQWLGNTKTCEPRPEPSALIQGSGVQCSAGAWPRPRHSRWGWLDSTTKYYRLTKVMSYFCFDQTLTYSVTQKKNMQTRVDVSDTECAAVLHTSRSTGAQTTTALPQGAPLQHPNAHP